MMSPLLELKNICVQFHQRRSVLTAINGLSLNVDRGEILGLVGESGAGKSVTGAAITGLIDPPGRLTSGEIWFDGVRIDTSPETVRGSKIGTIFQDPLTSLNPLRTIGDQLIETILAHKLVSRREAIALAKRGLEEVEIDPSRLQSYPHTFSGGMRQRVVIALALAASPELVIADEPTTALDVSVQAQILKLLRRICRERGAAVILITHDMGVIAETTDRVAVLYAGRLAEIGITQEILSTPQHPYTQGLMAAMPTIDAAISQKPLYQIPGAMPRLDALPTGCSYHPRCPQAREVCQQEVPPLHAGRAACWNLES